jgi:hypothetical protein
MSTGTADFDDVIRRLEVTRGDVENVLSAALLDIGETLVAAERQYTIEARAVDTGRYLAGWEADQVEKLRVIVKTDPQDEQGRSYASYVHAQPKYGGPPNLGVRVLDEVRAELEAQVTAAVSDRVRELLA